MIFFSEKRPWKFSDLEKMLSEDLYVLLDEIPSDDESIDSSESDDENNVEFDLAEQQSEMEISVVETIPEAVSIQDLSWESEDELPLATFLAVPKPNENFQWSKSLGNVVNPEPFAECSGPYNIPEETETPLEVFSLLFPEELFERIVFETNLYAVQEKLDNTYIPTTLDEMKCFIGVNVLMGIKRLPSYKDYWSARNEIRDYFIASCMSRNRFSWLLGHLHLHDNSIQPKKDHPLYDKLYKVRPMLDKLSETYAKYYKPSRCQSIDESMIRFKGRISFRQYMPMKPIKRGYKMWVRANESGFVSQFQIYTGNLKISDFFKN